MDQIEINLAQACQAYFIFAASSAVVANAIPALRESFVHYGPRKVEYGSEELRAESENSKKGVLAALLNVAGKLQVPHSWFMYYYVLSVVSSIFWAWQVGTKGAVFTFLVRHSWWSRGRSMTVNQVAIAWLFVFIQGCRRLYESVALAKPSKATVSLVSYTAAGVVFYIFVGISVWVEGIPALLYPGLSSTNIVFSKPSVKTVIAVPLFLLASSIQHGCHVYLSTLKKYTLPDNQLFQHVLCPHYTAECIIYLSLAIVAAPAEMLLNRTLGAALVFTVLNLSITAESTREWYVRKFGNEKVAARWKMLPLVY